MLDTDVFIDIDKGLDNVSEIVRKIVEQQGGVFKKAKEDNKRKVWYLDTRQHDLYNNNFLFRIRKEKSDDYKITFKNRHSDRYKGSII